jgi:hypothetical protein
LLLLLLLLLGLNIPGGPVVADFIDVGTEVDLQAGGVIGKRQGSCTLKCTL